jgi:dihydrofolate reductase
MRTELCTAECDKDMLIKKNNEIKWKSEAELFFFNPNFIVKAF